MLVRLRNLPLFTTLLFAAPGAMPPHYPPLSCCAAGGIVDNGGVRPADTTLQLLVRALAFAADRHRHQRRKDAAASPYINHPIELVRLLIIEAGIDDVVVLCAAALHDTIEDTDTSVEDLEYEFGAAIAQVVLEVTDDKRLPKETRKHLQIEHAPHASRAAKLVKLADKICNLRDMIASPPADWPLARRRDYFDWAERVVAGLRGVHPGLEAEVDALLARRHELG